MEWANVPYYKKQSIMREIYYDKIRFLVQFYSTVQETIDRSCKIGNNLTRQTTMTYITLRFLLLCDKTLKDLSPFPFFIWFILYLYN